MDNAVTLLRLALDREIQDGAQVVFYSPYEAVLVKHAQPMSAASHVLHLLLTLMTFGVWAIIWFARANGRPKPLRYGIGVDQFGQLYRFDPAKRVAV